MNEIINADHVAATSNRRQALNRLVGAAAVALTLPACGGGGGGDAENVGLTDPANPSNPASAPVGTVLPAPGTREVVVAGYVGNKGTYLAKLWGSGGEKSLGVDSRQEESIVYSVGFAAQGPVAVGSYAVSKSSLGFAPSNEPRLATIFDGVTRQTLNPERAAANGVFCIGNDVYVAGAVEVPSSDPAVRPTTQAVYWKNGQAITLSPDPKGFSAAGEIFVQNGDVYVSGQANLFTAAYWKNGVRVILNDKLSLARGLAVKGADVYVVGQSGGLNAAEEASGAVLWKNGAQNFLTNQANPTICDVANAVCVSASNDVYIVGDGRRRASVGVPPRAFLLKNGVEQDLEGATLGSVGMAVAVVGNDVYVAGNIAIGTGPSTTGLPRTAALWVNGKLQKLSDGKDYAIATSVAVR